MNRIKSIFISAATLVWAYFTYVFIVEVVYTGITLQGLGLFFVSLLPFFFFMGLLFIKPVARTSRSLSFITVLLAVGLLFLLIGFHLGNSNIDYRLIGGASMTLWIAYVYWYSYLPTPSLIIKVGNYLPELTFLGKDKKEVLTTDFIGKKVIYMFYRGNWCPLCMAQIKEISKQYREFEKRGVEVVLISPQPAGKSISLAKKMKVNFHFLTDKKNVMARELRIDHKHGVPLGFEVLGYAKETVLPTIIITDEDGKILFIDQTDNYRVRPEPATFLEVIGS